MLFALAAWVLIGAILGALVAPRNGWAPSVGAMIGGTFSLFGVLFLLVKEAPDD
jgi:hypothetical protein